MNKAVSITALSHFSYAVTTKFSTLVVLLLAQRTIDSREYLILVTIWASFQIIRSTIGLPLSFYSVSGNTYKQFSTIDTAYIALVITGAATSLYYFDTAINLTSIMLVVCLALVASFSTYLFGIILATNPKIAWLSIIANTALLALGLILFSQANQNISASLFLLWLLILAIIDLPILVFFTSIKRKLQTSPNTRISAPSESTARPTQLYVMAIAMTSMQIANYIGLIIAEKYYSSESEAYAVGYQLRAIALVFSGTINISAARWAIQTNFSNARLLWFSIILYSVFLLSSLLIFIIFSVFEIILIDGTHLHLIALTTVSAAAFATVMMQTCYLFGKNNFLSSMLHALFSTAMYLLPFSFAQNLQYAVALQLLCVIPSTIFFFALIKIESRSTVIPTVK